MHSTRRTGTVGTGTPVTMIGRSMGIDVAWGDTSKFAIVIIQYRNNKREVFYAESFEKPQMNEIINHVMQLKQRHHVLVFTWTVQIQKSYES